MAAYHTTEKTRARKAARRAKILEAARRLFAREGYHAATVPAIVAEAATSIGSFYFYFKDKEDVFAAVLEDFGARLAESLNSAIAVAAPRGTVAQMRAAVEGLAVFLAENPEEARIVIVESSGLGGRLNTIRRSIIAVHAGGVQKALEALKPPGIDAAVGARCWVGAVYEAVYHWLETQPEERPAVAELARLIAEFNLRGAGLAAPVEERE